MNNRLTISFRLVKASIQIMRANSDLLIYPIISTFGVLLVIVLSAGSVYAIKGFDLGAVADSSRMFRLMALFLLYFATYTVTFFANTALVGVVLTMLDDRPDDRLPTVSDGFQIARARLDRILGYALLMATVGMIFRWIFQFGGVAGRLLGPTIRRTVLASIFGIAWHLATYLIIPVLVIEGIGPIDALKRSASLLKKTWGEQIAGNLSLWLVFSFPLFLVVVAGYPLVSQAVRSQSQTVAVLTLYLYVMAVVTLSLVKATVDAIFSAIVYRYAVEGKTVSGFDQALMENAFRPTHGGFASRVRNLTHGR